MPIVDADAHVIETPKTWSYMREDEQEFRPQIFVRDARDGAPSNRHADCWVLDGRLINKSNVGDDVPLEARDMTNIDARLRHMDEIGIDIQVLFPTIFLRPLTKEHDVEMALCRSYNRWLSEIWSKSNGRLRWAAVPPLLSLIDAGRVRAELEFCKENGACAIFMRGMECDRLLSHRYFFPLYEIAQDLDLPITLHAGVGSKSYHDLLPLDMGGALMIFKFPVISSFNSLLVMQVPERFPGVRWAFIETSAEWVPYVLGESRLRLMRKGCRTSEDMLGDNNYYITTQQTDHLDWLLGEIGDDSLIVGTDYGHQDTATEVEALKRMAEDGSVPAETTRKILETNPTRLYALN